jgi:hypothetical protein
MLLECVVHFKPRLTKQLQHWRNRTWLYVHFTGNECLLAHGGVNGQLTIPVNITTLYSVVDWDGGNGERLVTIQVIHSEFQLPTKVSLAYVIFVTTVPTQLFSEHFECL